MEVVTLLKMPVEVGCKVELKGKEVGEVVECTKLVNGLYAAILEVPDELGHKMVAQTPGCSVGAKESGD